MQKEGPRVYKNSVDCGIKLLKQNGIRGILQGNVATVWREIPAYGAQFYCYEMCQAMLRDSNKKSGSVKGETSMWQNFLCGGAAGLACWTFSYPQDCVKTRIQVNPLGHYKSMFGDGGTVAAHAEIYRTHGMKGFWTGYSAVCGRAIFGNAVGFVCWELAKEYF